MRAGATPATSAARPGERQGSVGSWPAKKWPENQSRTARSTSGRAVPSAVNRSPTTKPPPWNHTRSGRGARPVRGVYHRTGRRPAAPGIDPYRTRTPDGVRLVAAVRSRKSRRAWAGVRSASDGQPMTRSQVSKARALGSRACMGFPRFRRPLRVGPVVVPRAGEGGNADLVTARDGLFALDAVGEPRDAAPGPEGVGRDVFAAGDRLVLDRRS